ncbi:MAG: RnfABCDGE type electron transport complex subunit D [Acutalibacteraceae bacterium]
MAWYYYGERAVKLALFSVLLSLALSFCGDLLLKKKPVFFSSSAAVTGLLIVLMLPASVSFSFLAACVAFAFFVCSLPFGNRDKLRSFLQQVRLRSPAFAQRHRFSPIPRLSIRYRNERSRICPRNLSCLLSFPW